MMVGGIRRILHAANVHRLSNRYSNRLSCFVVDEARRTFEEDIDRVLVDIKLTKRLQRVVAAALHLDRELIAPAPREPYSLLGRPEVTVLADEKGLEPLRGPVGLLVGRDLVAVREVVQIDPGAVGEAQRGPLPGLVQEVAPLPVDPPLPGHVDLAPDAVLSGVSDPAYDVDTRQRIIIASVFLPTLLNESLDAELVLGVHHLLRASEAQIVGELRGCDRQVHGVTVVGPLGAVVARHEPQRVGLRLPSVCPFQDCCLNSDAMCAVRRTYLPGTVMENHSYCYLLFRPLVIHSRIYCGQFLSVMLSSAQHFKKLTASSSTRVTSLKSKTMRRPSA